MAAAVNPARHPVINNCMQGSETREGVATSSGEWGGSDRPARTQCRREDRVRENILRNTQNIKEWFPICAVMCEGKFS